MKTRLDLTVAATKTRDPDELIGLLLATIAALALAEAKLEHCEFKLQQLTKQMCRIRSNYIINEDDMQKINKCKLTQH